MLLLVAIAPAPTPAQAPITLLLTGVALLSLSQLGDRRSS
jgi:hypothetical protein